MFNTEKEMLQALDEFIYKLKGLPKSKLRNELITKINEFLSDNKLDTDKDVFVKQ